jgi:hypothetical protein
LFTLELYSDENIKSFAEADHPSRASHIPSLGWRANWMYQGEGEPIGPTEDAWGLLSNIQNRSGRPLPIISPGQSEGRDGGGVILPDGAGDGDLVTLAIKVTIPDGTYGATLQFRLREEAGSLFACDAQLGPWPSEGTEGPTGDPVESSQPATVPSTGSPGR